MATVAEPQLVTPTETSYLYMARRQSLRLVRIPRGTSINPATGQREVGAIAGQAVQFSEGTLRVPKDGEMIMEDGRAVPAQEIAEWLDSHRLFGDVEEGFWRVDPTAPPVSEEEMERLTDAALDYDIDTLEKLLAQERAGWNRESVIRVAERSLRKIEEAKAEFERQAAEQEKAEAQAAKKGPAK